MKSNDFWDRGDRVIALSAGGAFFGGLLGQTPGAIVGCVLAAIFAWVTFEPEDNEVK